MEAVAAGDEVAGDLALEAVRAVADRGALADQVVDGNVPCLEDDDAARSEMRRREVLHHLLLAVDNDPLAREVGEVDPVCPPSELELDTVMDEPFPVHPLADAGLPQDLDRAVLQHAGPDAPLDPGAALALDDDRVDAGEVEQAREEKSGGACPDDADLGAGGGGWHGRVRG